MKNIALHILDLVENSTRAKSCNVLISIVEDVSCDKYTLTLTDDGSGMDEEQRQKATNPFYTSRTTRKVGLGLPLIQMNAEKTGGSFSLTSKLGGGTTLEAKFVMSHPDRLPLGEIDEVLVLLAVGLPMLRLVYRHITAVGEYRFDTEELREIMGNLEHCNLAVRKFLKEMILENLREIKAEL